MGITPAMMIGGLGAFGSLAGMFGNNQPSNVQLPTMQQGNVMPGFTGAQNSINSLGQYNIGGSFAPQATQAVSNLYNNPFAPGYQAGANQFGQLGVGNALTALQGAGMIGGTAPNMIGAGGAILGAGFDPQGDLYRRTASQVSDQALAGLAGSGLQTTPWGQGVYGNTMSNFNIDWQNNALSRMGAGIQGANSAYGGALNSLTGGFGLGSSAVGAGVQSAGMPWNAYGQIGGAQLGAIGQGNMLGQGMAAIPQMQAGDWLNYVSGVNQTNQVANQTAGLGLQQQQQGFDQSQTLGRNLGGSLAMMSGAYNPWGSGGGNPWGYQPMYGGSTQSGYGPPGGYFGAFR